MSPDLEHLIKLQELESKIASARLTIAAHPVRLADADARLNETKALVDAAIQRLKDNQEARRAAEKDAATYQGRLTKFRDQQSSVKTNKEYQALGHEIETAQHDLGTVEEKVIEQMVAADGITADVKRSEAALALRQKEVDAEKKALAQELTEVERTLKEAIEARTALVAQIGPSVMATFDRVAKARKGVAMSAATRDGLCSLCHVRLRPPVFQQVRANDAVIQCESCQRILYYVPPPPPIEPPVNVA